MAPIFFQGVWTETQGPLRPLPLLHPTDPHCLLTPSTVVCFSLLGPGPSLNSHATLNYCSVMLLPPPALCFHTQSCVQVCKCSACTCHPCSGQICVLQTLKSLIPSMPTLGTLNSCFLPTSPSPSFQGLPQSPSSGPTCPLGRAAQSLGPMVFLGTDENILKIFKY